MKNMIRELNRFQLSYDVIHREFDRSEMNIRLIIGQLSSVKSKNETNSENEFNSKDSLSAIRRRL